MRTNIRRRFLPAIMMLLPALLPAMQGPEPDDPPARVARISSILGTVSFQASGANDWSLATLNYTVTTGDRLFTGDGSRTELEVGPFAARLADNTDLTITNLTDHFLQIGLAQGTLRVSVYRLLRGDSLEVDTPNGALMLRAPGNYRVEVLGGESGTLVSVDAGSLEATGPGIAFTLRAGQAAQLVGTDPIQLSSVPRPGQSAFDQWSADRDRRFSASSCERYVSRDTPGCADLNDYGRWDEHTAYGPVWYPARVDAGWVPYRYGHWVWVQPWGWVWVEDEPWGFAPFHYGRWVVIGGAWGWVPGPIVPRPYYAPALVAFAGGSGFFVGVGVQAWFPLGPREPFFPWYHHREGYLREVNATNIRNVTNITTIIHVNSVENIHYVNRSAAMTVVSTETFRTGRPVGHDVMRVAPDQLEKARIVSHPSTAPDVRAERGGDVVARAPSAARPAMTTSRPALPVRGGRGGAPPLVTRNAPPPAGDRGRAASPPGRNPGAQSAPHPPNPDGAVPPMPRPLITRNPPVPINPPFATREPAMQEHPGRPLEPQQIQNIRAGKPAGPQRDGETPKHPAPPAKSPPPASKAPPPTRGRGGG
jgi:hypothetical protein